MYTLLQVKNDAYYYPYSFMWMFLCFAAMSVIAVGSDTIMGKCNHEEADTRIVVYTMDSLVKGCNHILV